LAGIFGHNLLDDPSMESILEELTGIAENKPFECIGTIYEVNVALNEAVNMYEKDDLPFLLKKFQQRSIHLYNSPEDIQQRLKRLEPVHFVPGRYGYPRCWQTANC
jgi:hypothetical protein